MSRFIVCTAITAALTASIGCSPQEGPAETSGFDAPAAPQATSAVINARWPFWPVRMRLHPLTRLATDPESGRPIIEARLEFRDEAGDTVKAVGQARFDLHDRDPRAGTSATLNTWEIDLRLLEKNKLHYDDLTQTYVFRLELSRRVSDTEVAPIVPPADATLRAYFLSVSGRRFEVTGPVR